MKTAESILSGGGAVFASLSAVFVLRLRPKDFSEGYGQTLLPNLVKAQRLPTVLALVAAMLGLAGTVVLALA